MRAVPSPALAAVLAAMVLTGFAADVVRGRDVSPEDRVAEIERRNISAPWRESAALIEALRRERIELPADLAARVELVRARNLALEGRNREAAEVLAPLLQPADRTVDFRLRAIILRVNVAANDADYATAFTWLDKALDLLEDSAVEHPRVLGMASYLHLRVGAEPKAIDYATRALRAARPLQDSREECMALSYLGQAQRADGELLAAEQAHREQIAACERSGDPVFVADAHRNLGRSLLEQGRPEAALSWLDGSLQRFEQVGYEPGVHETRLLATDARVQSGGTQPGLVEALRTSLAYFESAPHWANIEHAHRVMARLAELDQRHTDAIAHLQRAMDALKQVEEEARQRRLAYLQVQFDTRLKEQQIALLEADRQRQAAELSASQRARWLQALGIGSLLATTVLLFLMFGRAATQRRRYRELSERDGLTGLLNHQQVRQRGERAFAHSRRSLRPFTAVVADIDHFKRINDRYGHAAGDAVLRQLGALLAEVFPPEALLGRSGGEEFTILLPATAEQTRFLIEDLRGRIEPVTIYGHRVEYSLSFGLCQATERQAALEQTLRAADMALYEAKRGGRDRVCDATHQPEPRRPGAELVVVGSGIQLARHVSQRCLSEIEEAEVVLALTDGAAFGMLRELRPDLIDLRIHYGEGKDRRQTYREMDAAIMAELHAGKRVCAVFYGHPGVFADVPHAVIRKAREAGFPARMEPGISAEACLYSDLGIDPGRHGVQSLEATRFLVEDRPIDNRSLLLLWQVALTGDLACTRFHADPTELRRLVQRLQLDYPPEHEVILYEAAQLPVEPFRAERLRLCDLPLARFEEYTTLVVPPRTDLRPASPERLLATYARPAAGEPGKPPEHPGAR